MIGWWIIITAPAPQEAHTSTDRKAVVFANWETSAFGIEWIVRLVEQGKAVQLLHEGYPNRYTAIAQDVLPLIAKGPPALDGPTVFGDDYVMPGDWSGNVVLCHDMIAACPPELVLTIEAWDLS